MIPPSPSADPQAWARRPRRVRVLLAHPQRGSDEFLPAWVIERSPSGLCLAVPEALEVGTTLDVKPTSAPARAPWLAVQVVSCRRHEGRVEIDCRFVTVPSVMTLLLF